MYLLIVVIVLDFLLHLLDNGEVGPETTLVFRERVDRHDAFRADETVENQHAHEFVFVLAEVGGTSHTVYGAFVGAHVGECAHIHLITCLVYSSPSPRDADESRMPSSA